VPFGNFVWSVAATGSVVCVAGGDEVTAFNARSGKRRWRSAVDGLYVTAAAGLVVVESSRRDANLLTALSATTGRVRWTHKLADQPQYTTMSGDGFVFTRDAYGGLYAIHSDTGRAAWNRTLDTRSSVRRVGGGKLFVDDADGRIRALSVTTGAEVWSRRLGRSAANPYGESTAIGLSGGTLFVGTTDSAVHALNAADGSVLWSYEADAMNTPDSSSDPGWGALAADGLVVLSTRGGYIEAVSPPGESRGAAPNRTTNAAT
jgi:outer membrane protein assembly factor BamB